MENKIMTTMYEKEEKIIPVWLYVTQERHYRKMAIITIIKEVKKFHQQELSKRLLMII